MCHNPHSGTLPDDGGEIGAMGQCNGLLRAVVGYRRMVRTNASCIMYRLTDPSAG